MQHQVHFLDRTELFADLDPQFKAPIAERLDRASFRKGDTIVREGDPGDCLYLIAEGQCQVFVVDAELGVEFELARLGPGQAFGEMSILTGEPRGASVRATADTNCYLLRANVFQNIMLNAPQVALAICRVLATRLNQLNRDRGINVVSLRNYVFDRGVYGLVPHHVLMQKKAIPLTLEDDTVTVAMVNATDPTTIDELRRLLRGYRIKPVAISNEDYDRHIKEVVTPALGGRAAQQPGPARAAGVPKLQSIAFFGQTASTTEEERAAAVIPGDEVIAMVEALIAEGVAREASDIHIEPHDSGVDIRYRVEGMLQKRDGLVERRFYTPLVSRVKILAGMDISEKRRPQDGRISLAYGGRKIDMRVSSMPTSHGEKIVMRILDASNFNLPLARLLLAKQVAETVRRMVFAPYGVLFVTGPTGSGKTTTLYSALSERHQSSSHINIVTAEDPVEYDLRGVNQVQINPAIGLGFAEVLRTFLRQDPDVILVGEIRDAESAKIAMEAALTGHLVLTSLHTNSALGAVDRLRQMGMPSYLVANATLGMLAQRLLRRVCPACAAPQETSPTILKSLHEVGAYDMAKPFPIMGGNGCDACAGSGYKGRVGLYEMLQMSAPLRQAIATDMPTEELRKLAERKGLVSFARYGRFLLQNGVTTPSELLRNIQQDGEGESN